MGPRQSSEPITMMKQLSKVTDRQDGYYAFAQNADVCLLSGIILSNKRKISSELENI